MSEIPDAPLTGKALLQKVKELSHLPRRETAKLCGYCSKSKDGQLRVNLTDFYDAINKSNGSVKLGGFYPGYYGNYAFMLNLND